MSSIPRVRQNWPGSLLLPSLVKAGLAAQEEGDQLYQQVLIDLQWERFVGMQYFMTCWGIKHHQ